MENNYAFIDSHNLYLNIRSQGWSLDFFKFRVYLKEKYNVTKAYMFIGYIESNSKLYSTLRRAGFECVFKPTTIQKDGVVKGNCDVELTLKVLIDLDNYEKAVVITGDGDFLVLIKYLIIKNKLKSLIIPNSHSFSSLYRNKNLDPYLRFIDPLKEKLKYK